MVSYKKYNRYFFYLYSVYFFTVIFERFLNFRRVIFFFLNIFIMYSIISIFFIFLLFLFNFFISKKKFLVSKNSVFECGFESFSYVKENYDSKYFLVGIIFLIFDIEIVFLIPLSLNFFFLNFFGF